METRFSIHTWKGSHSETVQQDERKEYPNFMFSSYPDMLTVRQVMAALNVTEYTARALIRSKELESCKVRGSYRVPKSSLYEFTYNTKSKQDEQPTLYLLRRVC